MTDSTHRKPCKWNYDDMDDAWETACGEMWQFTDTSGPQENKMRFCPYCGGTLVIGEAP